MLPIVCKTIRIMTQGYFHHAGQLDESVGNTTLSERDLSHTFYPV